MEMTNEMLEKNAELVEHGDDNFGGLATGPIDEEKRSSSKRLKQTDDEKTSTAMEDRKHPALLRQREIDFFLTETFLDFPMKIDLVPVNMSQNHRDRQINDESFCNNATGIALRIQERLEPQLHELQQECLQPHVHELQQECLEPSLVRESLGLSLKENYQEEKIFEPVTHEEHVKLDVADDQNEKSLDFLGPLKEEDSSKLEIGQCLELKVEKGPEFQILENGVKFYKFI